MHAAAFIQDLAVIMLVAGMVTIIFHRMKQPVVLGYILAGLILGPHTPPFAMVHDNHTIEILAELGIVFLMFSLGLEFSLRKLRAVGATAVVAALVEIIVMIWLGYEIGSYFGWSSMDSIFLGAMLAISSTTIIVKALDELNMKHERFAQMIFGVLIVEDILGIGIIALLSGIAATGQVSTLDAAITISNLTLFMVVALVLGIIFVPKLLEYVAGFKRDEMLLITILGLCFGFCLLVMKLDYSVALGAFMIGAIMAESRRIRVIERLIMPIRDMFSAIFFVAIGLMLDPAIIIEYAKPVIVVTLVIIFGKIFACTLGAMAAGNDGRTSLRVGMGLSQIGEFSFIIAALGLTLGVTSSFLYPIAVAASVITTLTTPYLIKAADPLSSALARNMPARISQFFRLYSDWLDSNNHLPGSDGAILAGIYRKLLLQVFVNLCMVSALFLGAVWLVNGYLISLPSPTRDIMWQQAVTWGGALLLAAPFLIAAFRKLQSLGLLIADHTTQGMMGNDCGRVQRFIAKAVNVLAVIGMTLLILALSHRIMPPLDVWIVVLLIVAGLVALLWRWFVLLHYRMQIALLETLSQEKEEH
ncbi:MULTISPECIES: cation:proton antiporter [Methylobacillus]|uniref:Transporter, CPA2 family n=1 Tax=Methylobacillus flagellatus (strain ATCC 51484 / DSM 6875 / VKM B-1610 / KT) TaxID=265072 RepID=Q1H289_METFK|nr:MULTISPECIES: cation:proton antiporter [Methylobacillus]ABE49398.1 transporter, CPA2 family [Methylobacillus flagellatus KT]MPS48034.1 cation:proton antiporter [Methylobacillus sp.]